ncbi:MAG TPA: 3-hydroxybutyryl-CoA dehydrogenase [Stellaceae bacterium]|nr:3-hydroxybutyryl-CoA dehydrogenase [Stellaceae bacterium]
MSEALPVIAALGAGRMGRGIAHVFAYAGHRVVLVDVKARPEEAVRRLEREALGEIEAALAVLAEIGVFAAAEIPAILGRIGFAGRAAAPAALASAGYVFEGVPEVLEWKREALAFAAPYLGADTVLASTTSSFLVDALAELAPAPERFLNAHWLNPAYIIPLVELSPGRRTDPAVLARMKALLEAIGKVPVICAAAPGYIVPRIQALAMNEAARLVEEGIATAEDVDKATRYGIGFRSAAMGLLEFIDYGGGDILYYASRSLAEAMRDSRFAAPEIIDRNMREGRLGLRSGRGFYDFAGVDVAAYRKEVLRRLAGQLAHVDLLLPPGAAARKRGAA